ncbi:hypothetical protein BKI52_10065 [marine bacterium AO1-C]|nr:hypothetical protein BKI52_10065 [marine bacterium AO1-C]
MEDNKHLLLVKKFVLLKNKPVTKFVGQFIWINTPQGYSAKLKKTLFSGREGMMVYLFFRNWRCGEKY